MTSSEEISRILKSTAGVQDWGSTLPDDHPLSSVVYGVGVDSYNRMDGALNLFRGVMFKDPRITDYLRVLGAAWTSCDNVGHHRDYIAYLLRSVGRVRRREMMTAPERVVWDSLPSEFTVWRGCYAFNARGLSWSLDESIAREFPFKHRYRAPGKPVLLEAILKKAEVILKMGRGEAEIIAMPARRVVTTRTLDAQAGI